MAARKEKTCELVAVEFPELNQDQFDTLLGLMAELLTEERIRELPLHRGDDLQ